MFPRVILKETMIKKSQQKKIVSPCNYKERVFVLDTQELKYSECRPGKKPMLKGCIPLFRIRCVETVLCDVPIPCNYKYPFQVFYDSHYLYIFAPDNDCRQRWVKALKEETKHNNLVDKYHPKLWLAGKWRCCQQEEKLAAGCHVYDPDGCGMFSPDILLRDDEIPLKKDMEYLLIDSSQSDVWTVQDHQGSACTGKNCKLPHTFNERNLFFNCFSDVVFPFHPQGKEGAFMVRDSSQVGVFTVSVFTRAPGLNGEKNPRVKHYQIRQAETGKAAFYLAEKYLFSTIPQLIHYHQHNAAGLITRLRHPVSRYGCCTQEWQVNPTELVLGQELGSGQFGLVLEGTWRERKVAVKMMREECMSEDDFKEEAKVMMRLSHCKLVQLYGVCTQRSPLCLVFEFMDNGCLTDYLRARRGRLSPDQLLRMCLDVSEGMMYLESSNFIHRDLAARNCLVSKNNEVKVSDFGMTRFVFDDQYTSSQCSKFPVKWSAPEVIRYSKFSSKSDVWSFGVLMWEVYTEGRQPYEHQSNSEVVESLNKGLRLQKPRLAPRSMHILMEWCWKEKPDDRPSFGILLHEIGSLSDM
uniref:Tyrosine-protein kinase n=1 Tax=Salarias fasciatus TaxID=181472 RepID=A0A672JSA9_SALFA